MRVISTCLFAIALAASCPTISRASVTPFDMQRFAQADNPRLGLLYEFQGMPDGSWPNVLINVNGTLYGTTQYGGLPGSINGNGTVFSLTRSGVEHVIYQFKGPPDGVNPNSLVYVNGTLYGTTSFGGANACEYDLGCGTVFRITPSGNETVLHSFSGPPDGEGPAGAMIDVRGTLYGTTDSGGETVSGNATGTVFAITPSGNETVIHRFAGKPDGGEPSGSLVLVNGILYGTTRFGGARNDGTLFRIDSSGAEHVVYSFRGAPDAETPDSIIAAGDVLYGESVHGGTCTGEDEACGTVFQATTSGVERVLYSFQGGPADGSNPGGGLVDVHGVLYGTAGDGRHCFGRDGGYGCGILFRLRPSGQETVLHNFSGLSGNHGHQPQGDYPFALTDVDGTLYGTTDGPGRNCEACAGNGTIFSWML